mgnify:CR=1 FL=1
MINLTLTEALQKLNAGEISAVELTRAYLNRIEKYGADTIRFYLPYVSPVWTPIKFDEEGLKEVYSKFISTLKNTYSFFEIPTVRVEDVLKKINGQMFNGRVIDATAEEGMYVFDTSSTPSFFAGQFKDSFKEMWNRFTYNGESSKQQAVIFFNIKEKKQPYL